MKPLLTPAQMYALEKAHFDDGMPTLCAMENAACAFAEELESFCGLLAGKRIIVACGSGNNGGDGYAIARLAHEKGALVSLLPMIPIESLHGDALINARRATDDLCLPCVAHDGLPALFRPDIWVDALFGIGLNRPMSDLYAPLVHRIARDRAAGSIVAAVDVPSGLNAETGKIEGLCIEADLTVTFQYAKTGHFLLDGMDATGRLSVCSIGMDKFPPEDATQLVEPTDPCFAFLPRRRNTHKGTYGHLLIVAGSFGMTGAAAYAAEAALRLGTGLVTIACPRSIVQILQSILPAAMCIPLPEENGAISADALPVLVQALRGKSAAIAGPGLSIRAHPCAVRAVLESGLPAVIDADGLNLISAHDDLRALLNSRHVITPHPGEAKRLSPECGGSNPLADAQRLRKTGAVVLLKGAATVIQGGSIRISASGTPGMAKGGSGDVLTGLIGALLARGIPPEDAAWCASEIHGRCGELAAERHTEVCMTASDLTAMLPAAIRELRS